MICTTQSHLDVLMGHVNNSESWVIDIETTGLNPRQDAIIGIGLADATNSFYLPLGEYSTKDGVTALRPVLPQAEVKSVLELLKGKKLITYNGSFDLPFIRNYLGVDLVPSLWADVLLLVHTCDENRFTYGLKDVASDLFGQNVKAEQAEMQASIKANGGSDKEFYKADLTLIAKYCEQDCRLTWRVMQNYLPQLVSEGLENFYFIDEVMPLYREVTIPMQDHGVRLDLPLMHQSLAHINQDLASIEQNIQAAIKPYLADFEQWYLNNAYPPSRSGDLAQAVAEYANLNLPRTTSGKFSLTAANIQALPDSHFKRVLQKTDYLSKEELEACQRLLWAREQQPYMFNLSSKDHLKRLFFTKLKEQPLSKTPTGRPQCDDEFLDLMARKYDWAESLRTYNRLIKIRGTYIERFLERADGDMFYPQWKQHGTVTGRFSGDLQQLPRMLEDGQAPPVVCKHTNNIRNFFIAPEGCVLIDADYESLEPHVFAHISKDPAVIDIFKQGHDFYSTVAIRTERLQGYSADKQAPNYLGKLAKAKRQTAKAYALGIAYGEEDWKLHIELGIEQAEAKELVAGYWAGFPVLRQTSDSGKYHILQHGYISTEFGRRRRLKDAQWIGAKYGTKILDSLELWKAHNHEPAIYDQMKTYRKRLKKSLNAAINFPTQGGSASIVNRAAIALARAYKQAGVPATIIANIHDELLVSCQQGHEVEASEKMQICMENTTRLSVQLKAEPVIGTRYGAIK